MLKVTKVSKKYGHRTALEGITFSANANQIIGLLGENGAGKTTLLSIIAGCLQADSGQVQINGHDLSKDTIAAKGCLGFFPETPPLYSELTISEYLRFVIELKRVVKSDRSKHLEDILNLTGLREVAARKIGNLSHGYKQRVGLAQAICADPDVLLLDEPTNGLDPGQMTEFCSLIQRLSKDKTILISSHMLSVIQPLCDRIIILHHGKIAIDQDLTLKPERSLFHVRIAADPLLLLPALRSLPSTVRVQPYSHHDPMITEADVETSQPDSFPAELSTLLSGMGVVLTELYAKSDSLQDIYMNTLLKKEEIVR